MPQTFASMDAPHAPEIQAKILARVLDSCDLDETSQEALLATEGLSEVWIRGVGTSVPLLAYLRLFDRLAVLFAKPSLGLQLAGRMGPDLVGAIGYLFLNSPTLRDALSAFSESVFSIQGVTELIFSEDPQPVVAYAMTDDAMQPRRQDVEFSLGYVHALVRLYLGGRYNPVEVHFEHPLQGRLADYDSAFGCPVSFEQERNAMILRSDDMQRTNPAADAGLAAILRHYLQLVDYRDRAPGTWSERVNQLLSTSAAPHNMSSEKIARRLGLSADTLQRRLHSEGTSLRRIARQKRIAVAKRNLLETDLSVLEIAQALGYSETASFTRAFIAETGQGPSQFRKSVRRTEKGG